MPSKKPKKSDFKYATQNTLPAIGAIKTEWDLSTHYYKSETDPHIEKDVH